MSQNGKGSVQRPTNMDSYCTGWDRIFAKHREEREAHERQMQNAVSGCCHAPMFVEGETTKFYRCTKCNEPCDADQSEWGV